MDSKKIKNIIWITWENQLRNKSLSHEIGADLFQIESNSGLFIRYLTLLWKTFNIIRSTKAKNVVVQNPSIVLALCANLFCRLFSKFLVVDAHNGGIYPLDGASRALNFIAIIILKITPLTIVTNQALSEYVHQCGGHAVVVPDPLPDLAKIKQQDNTGISLLFICTWAIDEPYEEVIKAASILPQDYTLYISGKFSKGLDEGEIVSLSKNIHLTGFLTDKEYNELLNKVDITLDLTTRDDCLVCGAYESVALGKPMILSDTSALREYFYKGAIFTDNTAENIAEKVIEIVRNNKIYTEEVTELKNEINLEWVKYKDHLLSKMKN